MAIFRILGLDPGGTTGWATYTAEIVPTYAEGYNGGFEYYEEKWDCGQLGPKDHHNQLDIFLGMQQTDRFTIVCESFDYRNKSRAGLVLISREYIGVMKRFCQERNVEYIMQSASQGKVTKNSFTRKENLQKLGLWVPTGGSTMNHAMDGYGHILYYMIHNNIRKNELLSRGWK